MKRQTQSPGPLDLMFGASERKALIHLEYADEVRFGPAYYSLWVCCEDGERGPGMDEAYGGKAFLSSDARYVALERWRRLDRPSTEVVLLDLETGREAVLFEIDNGFAENVAFGTDDAQNPLLLARGIRFLEHRRDAVTFPAVRVDSADWRKVGWWS